jgi:hypothetical protein
MPAVPREFVECPIMDKKRVNTAFLGIHNPVRSLPQNDKVLSRCSFSVYIFSPYRGTHFFEGIVRAFHKFDRFILRILRAKYVVF